MYHRLTGLAPKALVVVLPPKLVGAAPKAGVACCAVLLPKGVAGRSTFLKKRRIEGEGGEGMGKRSRREERVK